MPIELGQRLGQEATHDGRTRAKPRKSIGVNPTGPTPTHR
jgi:hypothetical protein